MNDQVIEPIPHRIAIGWYLLCAAVVFGFIASGGNCKSGGIVYCYGDARDYWWHPTKVIFSLFFALFLPLPHILVAILFKSNRNIASILSICRKWHRGAGLFGVALLVLGFASLLLMNATGR